MAKGKRAKPKAADPMIDLANSIVPPDPPKRGRRSKPPAEAPPEDDRMEADEFEDLQKFVRGEPQDRFEGVDDHRDPDPDFSEDDTQLVEYEEADTDEVPDEQQFQQRAKRVMQGDPDDPEDVSDFDPLVEAANRGSYIPRPGHDPRTAKQIGFNQYAVRWDNQEMGRATNFQCDVNNELHCYGWWRRTSYGRAGTSEGFAIDIYAEYRRSENNPTPSQTDYPVDSLFYTEDPRLNINSLNADICAAINKWYFQRLNSNLESIDDLERRAKSPTIHVNRIATIDRILMQLREMRDTAIRCGGHRLCELRGDKDDQKLLISINVTQQAIALEGKVPSLEMGAMMDEAVDGRGRSPVRTRTVTHTPAPENVEALRAKLKATTDPKEARRLRATMRQMGIRGGTRGA